VTKEEGDLAIRREKRAMTLSLVITLLAATAGIAWIVYAFRQVTTLQVQKQQLKEEIRVLDEERDFRLKRRLKELPDLSDSIESVHGVRRRVVDIALDLEQNRIPYKYGGRSLERNGGFDTSGFIDHIFSQPNVGLVKNIWNCDQPCLMQLAQPAASISDLRPG
jgi:hypothetical protein